MRILTTRFPPTLEANVFADLPRIYGEPVSVVTVLDSAGRMADAVKSVFSQTYPNIEWIVVNNSGSSCEDVLRIASAGRPGITVSICSKVSEIEASRKMATSSRVCFLRERVRWEPGHIESLMRCNCPIPVSRVAFTVVGRGYEFRYPKHAKPKTASLSWFKGVCALWPKAAIDGLEVTKLDQLSKAVYLGVDPKAWGSTGHYTLRVLEVEDK